MQLNTYKTILGMIPPKVSQIGVLRVVICKDDIIERPRPRKETSKMHLIDFEAELKKSNMINYKQMAECLCVPQRLVQIKLCELVKKFVARRHVIGRKVFFSHVDNEANE
jgi:hypothetical protein